VTELPNDDSGVSDDGEGVEEPERVVAREKGRREDGQAISGPAHRLMLCLRCGGQRSTASSYCLARRGMEQDLGPGGCWS
jgi:hypothetical protein